MQIDAFFQKNKVWFFTAFSFLLSNTGIGSSRYTGNQTKVEISSRRGRLRNISRQSMNENMCIPGEDEAPSQQIRIRNTSCQKKNRKTWTKEENDKLLRQMHYNTPCLENSSWKKISKLFPGRSWQQCRAHWEKVLNPNVHKGFWSEEEDQKLNDAIKPYVNPYLLDFSLDGIQWKEIAKEIPGRTDKQCWARWRCISNPNVRKGPWDKEEDEMLIRLVGDAIKNNNNQIPWTDIAESLLSRTAAQCRQRWVYALDPNIKRGPWSKTESRKLKSIVQNFIKRNGNRKINWQVTAQSLAKKTDKVGYRTDRQCHSHWKYLLSLDFGQEFWTQDEDENLKEQLQNPPRDNQNRISWVKIVAESIPSKSPDACRNRAKKYESYIEHQSNITSAEEEDIETTETETEINEYQLMF
jgi:hypothetical protein